MLGRSWSVAAAVIGVVAVSLGVAPASAEAAPVVRAGNWVLVRSDALWSGYADQGLTTVGGTIVTRGRDSVPPALAALGWTHVGDPGSWRGAVLDAYQNSRGRPAKLFTLTGPSRPALRFLHRLAPGEAANNSFAAVAPGGRWFVSGEWGTVRRLLVFPLPTHSTADLRLAATIRLTRPVRDVQGCSFDGPRRLLCSTNDPGTDLFPSARQLLDLRLSRPVDGRAVTARPHFVGAIPAGFQCGGIAPAPGEVEGLDVARHVLRVLVNSPCTAETMLLTLSDSHAVHLDPDPHHLWALSVPPQPIVLLGGEVSELTAAPRTR